MLDTRYQVETPEGIALDAALAGPLVRIVAYLIDLAWRATALTLLMLLLFFAGKTGIGLLLVFSFLLEWFYPVFFEVYAKGQTPGKKAMNIRVVNDDLTPIRWSPSLVRNLLRAADFFPLFYLGGLLSMVFTARFQRLGDLAAGSLVIYEDMQATAFTLPDGVSRCVPMSLSWQDQLAVIALTQGHDSFSEARQQELAEILVDVLECDKKYALAEVQGIGLGLLG